MEDSGPRLNLPALIKKLVKPNSQSPVKQGQPVFPYVQRYFGKKSETHIYDRHQSHHHQQTLRPQIVRRSTFLKGKAMPTAPLPDLLLAVPLGLPHRRVSKRTTASLMRNTMY